MDNSCYPPKAKEVTEAESSVSEVKVLEPQDSFQDFEAKAQALTASVEVLENTRSQMDETLSSIYWRD